MIIDDNTIRSSNSNPIIVGAVVAYIFPVFFIELISGDLLSLPQHYLPCHLIFYFSTQPKQNQAAISDIFFSSVNFTF